MPRWSNAIWDRDPAAWKRLVAACDQIRAREMPDETFDRLTKRMSKGPHKTWVRTDLLPCGTHGAYWRHRVNGEDACQPCKDAANAYNQARLRAKLDK